MKILLLLFLALIATTVGVTFTVGNTQHIFQFAFFAVLGLSAVCAATGWI